MKQYLAKYKMILVCCILVMVLFMVCIVHYVVIKRDNNTIGQNDAPNIIQMQKSNTDIMALQQIDMVNAQTGWALTANNELLYTDHGMDDFQTVKKIQSIDAYSYADIFGLNETTVYLTYFNGKDIIVEYSQDRGVTWENTNIPHKEYADVVDAYKAFINFADEQNGYLLYCSTPAAGLMKKLLFKTTDGGGHFDMISDLSNEISGYPTGVAYANASSGYITTTYHGENEYLFCTTDGGVTWKSVELEEYEKPDISYVDAYPPDFFGEDNQEGKLVLKYVGTEKSSYVEYETSDGGSTWKISGLLDSSSLLNYSFYDEEGYWIDGEGNVLSTFRSL